MMDRAGGTSAAMPSKGGRPTRREAAERRAMRAAADFDLTIVPAALHRIGEMLGDPKTPPSVVPQLLVSAEALRVRLPKTEELTPEAAMPLLWEAKRVLGPEIERKYCERLDRIEAALMKLESVTPGLAEARDAIENQRRERPGLLLLDSDPIVELAASLDKRMNGNGAE